MNGMNKNPTDSLKRPNLKKCTVTTTIIVGAKEAFGPILAVLPDALLHAALPRAALPRAALLHAALLLNAALPRAALLRAALLLHAARLRAALCYPLGDHLAQIPTGTLAAVQVGTLARVVAKATQKIVSLMKPSPLTRVNNDKINDFSR